MNTNRNFISTSPKQMYLTLIHYHFSIVVVVWVGGVGGMGQWAGVFGGVTVSGVSASVGSGVWGVSRVGQWGSSVTVGGDSWGVSGAVDHGAGVSGVSGDWRDYSSGGDGQDGGENDLERNK